MKGQQSSDRLLAYSIMALSAFCGAGSIGLFASVPLGKWPIFRAPQNWPVTGVLGWDAALSLVFFFQHSGMVRRGFRDRYLARIIPPRYHPAVYSIASGIALTAVVLLWQPITDPHLLLLDINVGHPLLFVMTKVGAIFAIFFYFWGVFALGGFDLFGLTPIKDYLKGRPVERHSAFTVCGPYRWVRHPLYFSIVLLFWLYPELTLDRLLFNVLWTAWVWIGTHLEEIDLEKEFGTAYHQYQQSVPMLIPWCGPSVKTRFSDSQRE